MVNINHNKTEKPFTGSIWLGEKKALPMRNFQTKYQKHIFNMLNNEAARDEFTNWVKAKWAKYTNADTTYEDIRSRKTNLPCTLHQLLDMYFTIPKLREAFNKIDSDKEIELALEVINKKNAGKVNQTGEVTLREIGIELGGITAAAVKQIGDVAQEKMKSFAMLTKKDKRGSKCVYDFDIDDEEWNEKATEAANIFIRVARKNLQTTKNEKLYTQLENNQWILAEEGEYSVEEFLEDLLQEGYLTPSETALVTDAEYCKLYDLLDMVAKGQDEQVTAILLDDLAEFDNVVKVFQNINAKQWFPAGKRGRPAKS